MDEDESTQSGASSLTVHADTVIIGDNTNVSQPPVQNSSSSSTHTRAESLGTSVQESPQDKDSCVLEKCAKFIRQDYLNMYGTITEYPWQTKKKPLNNAFMAITLKSNATGNHHGCEQQHEDKMYKIFDGWEGCEKPTRVLLYGSPGIGKTTLCQKYAFDWANKDIATQRPPFNQFKVVIFLKLHDVKGTLEEIIEAQVFCTSLSPEERQRFFACMREHPEWFLFVLDGLNECKVDKLPDVKRFLEHKSYRVYLIATSRSELTRGWFNLYHDFHAHFCVRGYSEQSVLAFVASHLNDNPSKAEQLKEHIQATSNLMDLARIPLLTPIICEHWKECDQLPAVPTMTKLLNYCLNVVIKSFCHKMSIDWNRDSMLPPPIQEQLEHLEELALHGVMKGSMNYTDDELKEYHIDSTYDLGFLSAQPETSSPLKEGVHCFAHKSIQEFVAAKGLTKNLNSDKVSTMLTDENITKFHSVLVFIAGLLSNEQNDDLLKFIKQLSTSSAHGSFLENGCYGYRMQLILESCYEAWPMAEGIMSLTKTGELFQKVITPGELPLMGFAEAQGLSRIVRSLRLTSLNLSGIWIQSREARILAAECLRGNRSLTSVKFSNCCLCPDAVEAICHDLETMPKLEVVDLSCSNLSDTGLRAVAGLLRRHKGAIRTLQLDDYFDDKHVQQLKRTRKSSIQKHIIELCAFYDQCQERSHHDESSSMDFIAALNEAYELQEIALHHCQIGNQMEMLLNAFHSNEDLRKIRLCLKHLDEDLCKQLVTFVKNKPQLEEMSIILRDENVLPADMDKYLVDLENDINGGVKIKLTCHSHHQSVRSLHGILSSYRN